MKTIKEFPATHSMSTAWFVVDLEGNIALFNFDENGPVPVDIPEEADSSLMSSEKDCGETDGDGLNYLEFTDDQIQELMSEAVSPDKFDLTSEYDILVQVTEAHKQAFLATFARNVEFCLSHKHGIYHLSWLYGFSDPKSKKQHARDVFLRTVSRAVYAYPSAYTDEDFYGAKEKWRFPFYCYRQPYASGYELPRKTNVPKYPFKEAQIPEKQRHKLIRIPVKFAECTGFQIAQYAICHWYDAYFDDLEINGRTYCKFPKTGGGICYILQDQDKDKDGDAPVVLEAEE